MDGSICNTKFFLILAIIFAIGCVVSLVFVAMSLLKETPKTKEEIETNNSRFYTALPIMVVCFILFCISLVMCDRETCLRVFE